MLVYQEGFNWRVKHFWLKKERIFKVWIDYVSSVTGREYITMEDFEENIRNGNFRYMGTLVKIKE